MDITQECCEQSQTGPRGHTPQSTNYTATCLPSRKLSKLDETDCRILLEKQGRVHKWCTPMVPTYGWTKAERPARTYIQQLCEDTGCSPEDLPEAMNDREKWRERFSDIRRHDMMIMMIPWLYNKTVFILIIIWYDFCYHS